MANKNVSPETIIILINGLISIAFNLWSSIREIEGKEAIPSWEEILEKNTSLQIKIDAEK
jgi:head-tail adaptor